MTSSTPGTRRRSAVGDVVVGSLAAFGIIVSGAVIGVVVAGLLQWRSSVPDLIDDGLPLAVMAVSMVMAGRVAVDVAGRHGLLCAAGAAVLTAATGAALAINTSTHGDAIEAPHVIIAALVVLVLTGATVRITQWRRNPS